MTDWRRFEWQNRINRVATWARWVMLIAMADEAYVAIKYHWPLWDDIAMPLSFAVHQIAGFIQRHTSIHRIED